MRRREAHRQFGLTAVTGGLVATAGCSAILGEEEEGDGDRRRSGNLESKEISTEEGNDANVVVVVAITNHGDGEESAPLEVTLTVDDTVHEKTHQATVPGGQTKDVKVPFEVAFGTYEDAESRRISLDLK